ncbi:putative pectinesterase/pectinesterase inhibitor 36 [Camellia lanceoleosa]|uniref:Pectinesterase/pectinesterase inhibitor 36 n=1 Tax=Camellia lanceoleosa TaxID=1840588 RepID=A0ACC0ILE1_9ERIC|nr:putative pectinesterase/pectinesterase inhibitor 36 [Camellia lanceoleosa]
MLPETRRYNKMFNVFNDVADLATDCENRCDMVVEQLLELKGKLKEEVEIDYGNNKSSFVSNHHNSTTHGDGVLKSKESRTILDPVVLRQKGRPPCKRKKSMVEKVVNKKKKGAKTKTKTINIRRSVEQSKFGASSNMDLLILESEIFGPSLEQQNIFFKKTCYTKYGHHHPSPSSIFEHSSFTKMLNDIVQSQATNPEEDTNGVSSDGFWAKDMTFVNTAGPPKQQSGTKVEFGPCSLLPMQLQRLPGHTLCIDFIFGDATVVFQNCDIYVRRPMEKILEDSVSKDEP